jgi:hypothetical protein
MDWYDPSTWFSGPGEEFKRADPSNQATNPNDQNFAQQNPKIGQLINAGTTYENALLDYEDVQANGFYGVDQRNYMYGRDPAGADQAVNKAWGTGDAAVNYGTQASNIGYDMARQYANRGPQQGDWAQQNAALGMSSGYGTQLAGLESQQGPSAAQAQLQQGTNQAMGSQIAMARSGRGFGGGAGAAGLAQSNMAGIQANQANQAAQLRAQEDAAWRQRQAANLGSAAGIQQGIGQQYGQQVGTDLNAYYQNQGQNDAATQASINQANQAYMQGIGASLSGQGVAAGIRGQELGAGMNREDNYLRWAAAKQGYDLAQQQRQDQQNAAYIQAGASLGTSLLTKDWSDEGSS